MERVKRTRYIFSAFSFIVITAVLLLSVYRWGELKSEITAVGAVFYFLTIRSFWQSYMSPVLEIERVELATFHLRAPRINELGHQSCEYEANRIVVKNKGRSAAKNCKGYIVVGERKERVCWIVAKEQPKVTINANDEERLDFCAFYKGDPKYARIGKKQEKVPEIITPTEEGWPSNPLKCRSLDGIQECKILITAENAELVDTRINLNVEKGEIEIINC